MTLYDLARGLHILAVIAWMAGLLFLPRLYAYDAEQNGKPEPLKSEMQTLLGLWQTRLLRIIVNPSMILAFVFGLWLIHLDVQMRGAAFLGEPWMVTKLVGVVLLSGWHGFLAGEQHDKPVYPNADAAGGGHTVFQSVEEILVHPAGLVVAVLFQELLVFKTGALVNGVVEL